jgi:hypothetical protein
LRGGELPEVELGVVGELLGGEVGDVGDVGVDGEVFELDGPV